MQTYSYQNQFATSRVNSLGKSRLQESNLVQSRLNSSPYKGISNYGGQEYIGGGFNQSNSSYINKGISNYIGGSYNGGSYNGGAYNQSSFGQKKACCSGCEQGLPCAGTTNQRNFGSSVIISEVRHNPIHELPVSAVPIQHSYNTSTLKNSGYTSQTYRPPSRTQQPITQSRVEYIPFETKEYVCEAVQKCERVPYQREVVEYEQVQRTVRVPYQRKVTDYYAVQTQIQYVPEQIQECVIECEPVQRVSERVEYVPVQTQIVHYPEQKKTNCIPCQPSQPYQSSSNIHYDPYMKVHSGAHSDIRNMTFQNSNHQLKRSLVRNHSIGGTHNHL